MPSRCWPLLLLTMLAGCAGAPVPDQAEPFLNDSLFAPPPLPVRAHEVFELSRPMQEFLDGPVEQLVRREGPRQGLMDALRDRLHLEYDAELTRNAAQAFEARAGNCMSLAILTASLARELKIPVRYQLVFGQETWGRSNGMLFYSGHINLVLGPRSAMRAGVEPAEDMTVDFLPPREVARYYGRTVPESLVLAMYMNNRAAEVMAAGDVVQAYWYAREAVRTSPGYAAAYNTLGVIYRRHGNLPEAERVLQYALQREPDNAQVLSNLALVLAARGDDEGAGRARKRLREITAYPPYYFFDRGLAAFRQGDFTAALAQFRKELKRMPYDDQLHFLVALTSLKQGQLPAAQKELALAMESSVTREQRAIYASKLEHLKSMTQ